MKSLAVRPSGATFAFVLVALGAPACSKTADSTMDAGADAGSTKSALRDAAALSDAASGSGSLLLDGATAGLPTVDAGPADDAIPTSTPEEWAVRGRHLLEALAADSPELCADVVFPKDAFAASHEAIDPSKLWEKQVLAPFRRQLKTQHKKLKGIDKAVVTGFELGHTMMQVTPKKKEWKKPLWRVRHSKLLFTLEGKPHRLEIAEMMGWQGAWYVTKLHGI
ncbi:MAG: hypothetical protein U0169_03700 [Polyangiaceae bacterium]